MFEVTHTMFRDATMVVYLYGEARAAVYEVSGGDLTATLADVSWHRRPGFGYESLAEFEVSAVQHGATVKRLLNEPDTPQP